MLDRLIKSAFFFFGIVVASSAALAQGSSSQQGMLNCTTAASVGLIVGSTQRINCQFKSAAGWVQNYQGRINRVGLDIGITAGGVMAWAVLGSSSAIQPGALTGHFVGASGEISAGIGVGANVLIGGTDRSISLQPLSVEAQVGVNLALGVAGMTLTPIP